MTLPTAVTLLTLAMLIAGYLLGSIPSGYLAGHGCWQGHGCRVQ